MLVLTKETENKVKKYIFAFLKSKQSIRHSFDDNIIYARKSFIAASFIRYYLFKQINKEISKQQFEQYLKTVDCFLKNDVEICWQYGIIKVTKSNL